MTGDTLRFHVERVTIEPFDLRQPSRYDVVIDRLTHWYHTSREWIKKAILLNDLYVYNNPWSLQSNEKQTTYCAMMRLGLPVPDTWLIPPKAYKHSADLQPTLRALRPLLRPRRDRPEDRLSAVHEALRRRRLGRRQQDRQRAGAVARLRAQRHADHEPAGRRRALRLFRALHRPRAADPLRQLRSGRAAAQPLPARHRLPGRGGPLGARGHDAHDQQLLRLGLQFLRGAAQGRHLVSDRLRQCLPGLARSPRCTTTSPG